VIENITAHRYWPSRRMGWVLRLDSLGVFAKAIRVQANGDKDAAQWYPGRHAGE
jgi:hypothetical protein